MALDQRFEIRLPSDQRRELDALAERTGVSASALARFSIMQMLRGAPAEPQGKETPK